MKTTLNAGNRINGATNGSPSIDVQLPRLNLRFLEFLVVGDSSYVCHAWGAKAKTMIKDKQEKKPTQAKQAKNFAQEYEDCFYKTEDGQYGIPATAFKAAAVDACSHIDGITKVEARGAFHVVGDILPIQGEPTYREDMVRVGMGTADIRPRPEFKKWRVKIAVRFNADVLTEAQVIHLFNTAGFAIGVGEHRPQKDGSWGMFHVE